MILRACTVCGALSDQARCETHRPKDERPSAARRGYDGRWQRIRARYLRAHPVCEDPAGCNLPAVDVDHIDGSGPFGDNTDSNLRALCRPHHSRKTVLADGGFGRARSQARE